MRVLAALTLYLTLGQAALRKSLNSPTVDLGYSSFQGSLQITASGFRYANFTNIRYAAPPTGTHRFSLPVAPVPDNVLHTAGNVPIQCPQGTAAWQKYVGQKVGNLTQMPTVQIQDIAPAAVGESEDCLFLDVLAPEGVFRAQGRAKVPVIVFLHGGGYTEGSKTEYGPGVSSGIGLVEAAAQDNKEVIYVAINYRLGAFGFLAGQHVPQASTNLGLRDQIFALQWVQQYIRQFGGDSDHVTLMGQSAGAGAILHHLAAPESAVRTLFHATILQSPWSLGIPSSKQEEMFKQVLFATNTTSFAQLIHTPTERLQAANKLVVANAQPYGSFGFGPSDIKWSLFPQHALSAPKLLGHVTNEGAIFASPFVQDNDASLRSFLAALFPRLSPSSLHSLIQAVYPSDWSGVQGYTTPHERLAEIYADATIVCNTLRLQNQSAPHTSEPLYVYEFSVPPAYHSGDLRFTFWNRAVNGERAGWNSTLAQRMQQYLTSFAIGGSPNQLGDAESMSPEWWPDFHATGTSGGVIQNLNSTGLGPKLAGPVKVQKEMRCEWWLREMS